MSDFFDTQQILSDHDPSNTAAVLSAVNQLPVRLLDFVQIAGLKNRGYGVRTWADPDKWERDWLNGCARTHLWRLLYAEQQNLFTEKRITLVPTYHFEEHMWTPGKALQLRFPFISAINVIRAFTSVGSVSVSPYIASSLPVAAVSTFFETLVPRNVVHSIEKVWFREDKTFESAPVQYLRKPIDQTGYPYASGSDWGFALGGDVNALSTVHAQDSDYTYIDIDPVANKVITDIVFMHPDQDQEMMQALSPQSVTVLGVPKWRYWFYYWMFKRPEYYDLQIDMSEESPFRYFYDTLRYGYYTETETPGVLYAYDETCSPDAQVDLTYDFMIKIVKASEGVVLGNPVKLNPDTGEYDVDWCQLEGRPYKVKVYYKTDINKFGLYISGTQYLKQAICAKVAANLPIEECDCGFAENNYITHMREDLPEIIPVPFSQPLANYKYGRRRGDQEYTNLLQRIILKGRRILV